MRFCPLLPDSSLWSFQDMKADSHWRRRFSVPPSKARSVSSMKGHRSRTARPEILSPGSGWQYPGSNAAAVPNSCCKPYCPVGQISCPCAHASRHLAARKYVQVLAVLDLGSAPCRLMFRGSHAGTTSENTFCLTAPVSAATSRISAKSSICRVSECGRPRRQRLCLQLDPLRTSIGRFEVYLDGAWWLVDATGSSRSNIVRSPWPDAADICFPYTSGSCEMPLSQSVSATGQTLNYGQAPHAPLNGPETGAVHGAWAKPGQASAGRAVP